MPKLARYLAAAVLPWLVVGCASSTLTISLDLYKDDPSPMAPLSQRQVVELFEGLLSAEAEAEALATSRKELGRRITDLYLTFYVADSKTRDETFTIADAMDEQSDLLRYRREFEEAVDARLEAFRKNLDSASLALEEYLRLHRSAMAPASDPELALKALAKQVEALTASDEVILGLPKVGRPLGTDFETFIKAQWQTVADRAEARTQALPSFSDLVQEIRSLSETLRDLRRRGLSEATGLLRRLAAIEGRMEDNESSHRRSVAAIAAVATAIPTSLGIGDRGRAALAALTSSSTVLFSQIDRLQDPADPVWRIVSDPKNEKNWHKEFAKPYFHAKGDSSVVVVRDTPISFRVQRGDNDPAALVRSQLKITRAISSTAVAIAGAATGVNLTPLAGSEQEDAQAGEEGIAESEALARRQAEIESRSAQRATVASVLATNLQSLRSQLVDTDDAEVHAGIERHLKGILTAYRSIFVGEESDDEEEDEEAGDDEEEDEEAGDDEEEDDGEEDDDTIFR